ncbi:histidine phosphatase family protein [Massilia sp. IC2-477]|uniref:SixA phosphatase family protein n=1 Tax=Massilia sp. IC2-477 TaxID=2887198 RepID=UPI001D12262D|nr:phosphoglycerate mutase family protein [Massilia sp. IC2-477]MCC2955195.1 histidine phosphatase family protein [Massilia sp. IC2-477]
MSLPARLFRCLSLSLAILAPGVALAEPSAIYLVRHGEKAAVGQDPELTPQGQARAQAIATILARTGITSIHSTPTQRTRQTAQPLAQRLGLDVQLYDPRAPKALVEKVKGLSGPVLVVGHSNTLPELVRLFGGAPGSDIGDEEYDRLYQLTPMSGGGVRTVLFSTPSAP